MSVRVPPTQTQRPSLEDGDEVCYLLLHLGVPHQEIWPPSAVERDILRSAKIAGRQMDVTVWAAALLWGEHAFESGLRYLMRFPRWRRDDARASRIGESVLYAVSLVCGPVFEMKEMVAVFGIPAAVAREKETLRLNGLLQTNVARGFDIEALYFPASTLGEAFYLSQLHVDAAWKIAPLLVQDEPLYRATRFLKASQEGFHVWAGESEVLDHMDCAATTGAEQTSFERALQDAFKAVEAVVGDPPKDDRKFFRKIRKAGLDPHQELGYPDAMELHRVIRDMNEARDKKAAHGSTKPRPITIGELLDYQACARHVVSRAVEHKLGHPIP